MDPDPDPTVDPTPFFSDFKDVKNLVFSYFFSYNLLAGTLLSVLIFLWKKFCVKFNFASIISVRSTSL